MDPSLRKDQAPHRRVRQWSQPPDLSEAVDNPALAPRTARRRSGWSQAPGSCRPRSGPCRPRQPRAIRSGWDRPTWHLARARSCRPRPLARRMWSVKTAPVPPIRADSPQRHVATFQPMRIMHWPTPSWLGTTEAATLHLIQSRSEPKATATPRSLPSPRVRRRYSQEADSKSESLVRRDTEKVFMGSSERRNGVEGSSLLGAGIYGHSRDGDGIVGRGGRWAARFEGGVLVQGHIDFKEHSMPPVPTSGSRSALPARQRCRQEPGSRPVPERYGTGRCHGAVKVSRVATASQHGLLSRPDRDPHRRVRAAGDRPPGRQSSSRSQSSPATRSTATSEGELHRPRRVRKGLGCDEGRPRLRSRTWNGSTSSHHGSDHPCKQS